MEPATLARPRWPAVDGLRAVAALCVVAFHAKVPGVQGGFVGVDVFFVLSGFLITGVLLDRADGLIAFWRRRMMRLAPALIGYVAVSLVVTATILRVGDGGHTAAAVLPTIAYLSNWFKAVGIWNLGVFGHTWSLAVEEQFYLLWPVALLLLRRWLPSLRAVAWATFGLVVLAAVLRLAVYLYAGPGSVGLLYNGTPFRADALLLGSLVAICVRCGWQPSNLPAAARQVATGASLIVLVVATGQLARDNHYPLLYLGGFTVIAAASAVVIIRLTHDPSAWMVRILQARPLVALGRISYGIYLWHFLAVQLVQSRMPGAPWPVAFGVVLLLTIGAATASWRWLEEPLLSRHSRRPAPVVAERSEMAVACR